MTPKTVAQQHQQGAEVGLQQDQHGRDGGNRQHRQHVDVPDLALAPRALGAFGDDERHPGADRQLGELGRLDRHPADHDPAARAVDRGSHRQHEQQADQRGDVDHRGQDPHPAVVRGRDEDGEHEPDRDVDQVSAQEGQGVAAGERVLLRGRRPHEQRPEDEQGRGREQQRPVDAGDASQAGLDAGDAGPARGPAGGPAGPGDAHPWLLGSVAGGRIDPSCAKVGSFCGGVTPGMAVSADRTVMPRTPYRDSKILRTAGPEVPEPVPPWDTIITTT